jgi:hypothetical protein
MHGERLEYKGVGTPVNSIYRGLDALEHPGPCVDVLVNAGTPLRVQVDFGGGIVQANHAQAHGRHGVPRWPWWPLYTSRVMTNSSR